jgi:hypothetical protein
LTELTDVGMAERIEGDMTVGLFNLFLMRWLIFIGFEYKVSIPNNFPL